MATTGYIRATLRGGAPDGAGADRLPGPRPATGGGTWQYHQSLRGVAGDQRPAREVHSSDPGDRDGIQLVVREVRTLQISPKTEAQEPASKSLGARLLARDSEQILRRARVPLDHPISPTADFRGKSHPPDRQGPHRAQRGGKNRIRRRSNSRSHSRRCGPERSSIVVRPRGRDNGASMMINAGRAVWTKARMSSSVYATDAIT